MPRSIAELQEQNQRLLEVVRELSDKQEAEERAVSDERFIFFLGKYKKAITIYI